MHAPQPQTNSGHASAHRRQHTTARRGAQRAHATQALTGPRQHAHRHRGRGRALRRRRGEVLQQRLQPARAPQRRLRLLRCARASARLPAAARAAAPLEPACSVRSKNSSGSSTTPPAAASLATSSARARAWTHHATATHAHARARTRPTATAYRALQRQRRGPPPHKRGGGPTSVRGEPQAGLRDGREREVGGAGGGQDVAQLPRAGQHVRVAPRCRHVLHLTAQQPP